MKYKLFSIFKVTEFRCLSIIHLSVSLPLRTHRCNTWDAVRADRLGVHFSIPFHFYLYIELYSSGGNRITLPTLQLSASLRVTPTYTEYEQGFRHRQFAGLFHVLAPAVWMPRPAALLRHTYIYIYIYIVTTSIVTAYVVLQFTANATIFTHTHSNDSHCIMTKLNNINWLFSFCYVMSLTMGFHKHVFNIID